jgi:UDP-N-acetylmuramate dehydrogenase
MTEVLIKLAKVIDIAEDYQLSKLTTFCVGGSAKYFCEVTSVKQLQAVLSICKDSDLPIFVIGGGSNLLISDKGFDGLVLKLNLNVLSVNDNIIEVSADRLLNKLIDKTIEYGLSGIEGLAGIPGTVGGALVGNAGAYGDEIANVVDHVDALDEKYNLIQLKKEELNFKYRHSIFKERTLILLQARLQFQKHDQKEVADKVVKYRQDRTAKHPPFPSAGCTFKNIDLTDEIESKLKQLDFDLPEKFVEFKKVPVAWLLDQLGLKGKQIGGAQVSEKHGNFIINKDNASADDIVMLISYIKQQVRDQVGVQLQEEVRYVGFSD